MKLFLDCEFNGFQGELISLALVAEDGEEFYSYLKCPSPVEWVAENVIPVLGKYSQMPDTFAPFTEISPRVLDAV